MPSSIALHFIFGDKVSFGTWTSLVGQWMSETHLSQTLQLWGDRCVLPYSSFYVGAGDLNSGPSFTKHLPWPVSSNFIKNLTTSVWPDLFCPPSRSAHFQHPLLIGLLIFHHPPGGWWVAWAALNKNLVRLAWVELPFLLNRTLHPSSWPWRSFACAVFILEPRSTSYLFLYHSSPN